MDESTFPPRYITMPAEEAPLRRIALLGRDGLVHDKPLFGLEDAQTVDAFNEALRGAFRKLDMQRRRNSQPAQ